MKRLFFLLIIALTVPVSVFSQGIIEFNVNFGGNPPPHTPGVPESGMRLTDDSFYAAIYLSGVEPTSARIVEVGEGDTVTPVFDFTTLVFAGYPSPATGPAFSYENTWQLTTPQINNLIAGRWYAQVFYGDTSYLGRITPVPEPSSFALISGGLMFAALMRRKHSA